MRYLFITHDRSLPSPFLTDLTADHWVQLDAKSSSEDSLHSAWDDVEM